MTEIRIADIARAGLPAETKIELIAAALTELGTFQGLILIHGVDQAYTRYREAGGRVRFDQDGTPLISYSP